MFQGWWAATVATYCPSRPGELPKSKSTQPRPRSAKRCVTLYSPCPSLLLGRQFLDVANTICVAHGSRAAFKKPLLSNLSVYVCVSGQFHLFWLPPSFSGYLPPLLRRRQPRLLRKRPRHLDSRDPPPLSQDAGHPRRDQGQSVSPSA